MTGSGGRVMAVHSEGRGRGATWAPLHVSAHDGMEKRGEGEEHGDDSEGDHAADDHHEDGGDDGGECAESLVGLVFVHAREHAEGGGEIAGAGGEFEGGGNGGGED